MSTAIGVMLAILLAGEQMLDDPRERLDKVMQGRFESTDPDNPFTDTRIRIDAPALGDYVYYYQLNDGPELEVYRQRILVLSLNEDGNPSQVALNLTHPSKYEDASAAMFAGLTEQDVEPGLPDGCEQIWTDWSHGWRGIVDPENCVVISTRSGKPRKIGAESWINSHSMRLAERGFDENGEQLFGTEPGEYLELRRVDD